MSRDINDVLVELEDYDLQEVISNNSFEVVFRAIETKTGKEVALKVLFDLNTSDQATFLRDNSVLRLLNFPGIVKFLGFRFPLTYQARDKLIKKDPTKVNSNMMLKDKQLDFDLSGTIIVTELMKNGSLDIIVQEYLKNNGKVTDKINPTIRSKIIFGVAATMKQLYKNNIIHRDLKLENIYLDDNMEPKIANFKTSNSHFDFDQLMFVENQYIIAPEIIMDEEAPHFAVDVYAFAFLIYKMFTNKIEFADKIKIRGRQQFFMTIARGDRPKRPESIPDPYWELIQKCWKQAPEERMSFDEITEELKNDIYAIDEFGMRTDLDELHEYQERIDKDE